MVVPMIGIGQCISGDCENGYGVKITTVPNLLDGGEGSEVYYGNFVDGKRNGVGQCLYPDGSKYIGEFANNLPDGYGTWIFYSPTEGVFSGHFKGGLMDGLCHWSGSGSVSFSDYKNGRTKEVLYKKSK